MRGNDVVGLIFANMHDEQIHELTGIRTMASVPFGGRYRFIDFSLSSMVKLPPGTSLHIFYMPLRFFPPFAEL